MPELPEVETVRATLDGVIKGKKISRVLLYRPINVETDPIEFVHSLEGRTFDRVDRKGKLLLFFLGDLVITSHLRMEGKYFYQEKAEPKDKHDILRFEFTDNSCLVYNDVRKFGRLGLYSLNDYKASSSFAKLGPEPFDLNGEDLYRSLSKYHGNIKEALMDQSIVSGIGNIYCDETLFACHLHPLTPAKEISLAQARALVQESSRILNEAIEEGGSTVRSYHPGKGIDGMMQSKLLVYGRANKPCASCGFPLKKTFVNGRGTTYCPKCQKNPHRPFVLGVTGPIHAGKSTVSAYFVSKGFILFDADKTAKNAYADPTCKKAIKRLLGKDSYQEKEPNLSYIREKVSLDPKLRKKLESIIHPYVIRQAEELINHTPVHSSIVLDVPLLFPSHMDELCDASLLVLSEFSLRAKRLEKEGRDVATLTKINAEYPLSEAKKKASFIVSNDASVDELCTELDRLNISRPL